MMTFDPLDGMTQERWNSLGDNQRAMIRDNSKLSQQLIGWEGWRVEVVYLSGRIRRCIVGKSTGWRPIHLEICRINSHGGEPAREKYRSVTPIKKVR